MNQRESGKEQGVKRYMETISTTRRDMTPTDSVAGAPRRASGRAGQTLVVALSVMFLLFFMGALFVALIARNLNRVEQVGNRTSAATLAESGLNWVNTQLTYSELGADWRPSPTWPTRTARPGEAVRLRDPDYGWLSDNGTYQKPWTRILSGDGRFLIRVDYEPSYRSIKENETAAFDPLSSHLHIQAVGRPGRLSDDPTLLVQAGSPFTRVGPDGQPQQILGEYHQLEAWKPIGLTDQLWWITNINKERGPAVIGVPPFQDGHGRTVVYQQEFEGGFRSNMDVLFAGPTRFHLDTASGEAVVTSGDFRLGEVPNGSGAAPVPVELNYSNETQNSVVNVAAPSSDGTAADFARANQGSSHGTYLDSQWLADNGIPDSRRSIRYLDPPSLDVTESGSADNRYRRMTRDTGTNVEITQGGARQLVNAGDYGFGDGIYLDNFTDIQYASNRDGVVDEWLRRGPPDVAQTGWSGSFYTPSVRESGTVHPIALVELLPEGIRLTRYDRDVRGRNLGADSQYKARIFYRAFSKAHPDRLPLGPTDLDPTKGLEPVGPSILMPYPPSGVLYTEGSIRIKGTIGRRPEPELGETVGSPVPVQLTVVSGGSIYIEGNLVKAHPASRLALLAKDYVCLNPTQFTAVRPYEDVTIDPDGGNSKGFHYSVPQSKDLDLLFGSSAPLQAPGMLLNLQHSAGFSDNSSNTSVSMYVNGLEPGNRYDFRSGAVKPQYPPAGGAAVGDNPYQFQFFPPPADPNWWLNAWGVTNFQSSSASAVNYERKSFWLPKEMLKTEAGAQNSFRFHVEPTPDGQPWWLAGASLTPYHAPLDIEVEAVIYAQTGSWFVVPTPWFNENPLDSREIFRSGDSTSNRAPGNRAYGTFPTNTDDYPFYREPLNVQVTVRGSISEGQTADGSVKSQWIKKMTMDLTDPASGKKLGEDLSLPSWYQPNIRYVYDQDLRDWVRYRNVVTGKEGIAYTGPPKPSVTTPRLKQVRNDAIARGQNIVTLPILPRLPTSGTLFRGRPL